MKTFDQLVLRFKDQDASPPIKSEASQWLRNRAVAYPISQWDILTCCIAAVDRVSSELLKTFSTEGDRFLQFEPTQINQLVNTITVVRKKNTMELILHDDCAHLKNSLKYDIEEYNKMLLNLQDFFQMLGNEEDKEIRIYYEK